MTHPSIVSFGPDRTWVAPGAGFVVNAIVGAFEPVAATATISLLDLDQVVHSRRLELLPAPAPQALSVSLAMPPAPRHGYGLKLVLEWADSTVEATSAIEALEGWWESPRMSAITEYDDAQSTAERVSRLQDWHVTVMQHYDWMWRHYRYTPPDGAAEFEDALGRRVSHAALRGAIDAGHTAGIASLAYGSVYGAEKEHVDRHPDDRVFNEDGHPLSLGSRFFINDLRPGTPWRHRLLALYRDALRDFHFDGIHMDTYGDPHGAISHDGEAIDFAALYPGLIDEAAQTVATTMPGATVTFNCVDGYPLEAVAPAAAACLYLELWATDGAFGDVLRWVERARSVAGRRQVVIAAYGLALGSLADDQHRAEAIEATLMLGIVTTVAGGYHHTIAEGDRLLVEGYYPAAVGLTSQETEALTSLPRFNARYLHLLSDPLLLPADLHRLRLLDADGIQVESSARPVAGSVWLFGKVTEDGTRVIHLVDLRGQLHDRWTVPLEVPPSATGLHLHGLESRSVLAASPWGRNGDARVVRSTATSAPLRLPAFDRWLMLVMPPSAETDGDAFADVAPDKGAPISRGTRRSTASFGYGTKAARGTRPDSRGNCGL